MRHARIWPWMAFLFAQALVSFGANGIFREQVIPRAAAGATSVVAGPDLGFWFTEFDANRIGTFSQDGQFREFTVPTPDAGPYGITTDYSAIWFTELKAGKIGKLTMDGVFTEYVIPTSHSAPWGITFVDKIWFTESAANKIGYFNPDGSIKELTIPTANAVPRGMAAGFAFEPCFAEFGANQIACVEGNQIVERRLPNPSSGPQDITGQTNLGDVFFTEVTGNRIGVLRPIPPFAQAPIEEFAIPTSGSGLAGIVVDPFESVAWFTEKSAGQVGSISSDGRITEYPLSDRLSQPMGMAISFLLGPELQVQFVESAGNRLVEFHEDVVLIAGATSGTWATELSFANVESSPVTVFASFFPRPEYVCPSSCPIGQYRQGFPPGGSWTGGIDYGLAPFHVRVLEDGILPSVKARVFNFAVPGPSVDLPTIRLSRLIELNPGVLCFPGAVKGGQARSNLWFAEAGGTEPLDAVIELVDPDGTVVASREQSLGAGSSIYLVDVIGRLGVGSFPEGQLRVRKIGSQGLLWGYLATVREDGAISIFLGLNP